MYFYKSLLTLIILIPSFYASAQEKDSDIQSNNVGWISYRDVYKEMLWFEKYGGQKHLIQSKLHILYKDASVKSIKPRLKLIGKTINLSLPLDAMNRTSLPLIKTAYDENAELILSSLPEQHISNIKFQSKISFHLRADGIYEVADLMLACKQALQYQNYLHVSFGKRQECIGIKILFSENENIINVRRKSDQATDKTLSFTEENSIFEGDSLKLKVVTFLFNQVSEKSQIMTKTMPIAIMPIIE